MLTPPANAAWIGSAHPFDLHETYLCLRSPLEWRIADDGPREGALAELGPAGCETDSVSMNERRAVLFITADSRYKVWLNGQFLGRGPARCWPHAQSVDQWDVTAWLRTGANTLCVHVYQPGYSHFAYVHRGATGLLAWLERDGQVVLTTDTTWRVRRDPSFDSRVHRVSIYGSGVEVRDLALVEAWTEPDFDASGWETPRVVAPPGGYPWTGLRLRELPLLVERETPTALVAHWTSTALCLHLNDPHAALRTAWQAAEPAALPNDQDGWLSAVLGSGQSGYWLYDLGQDFTCQGWLEVERAAGDEQLAVSYVESVVAGQPVISDPDTYCRVRLTDCYRLRPGEQRLEPFALRGGRYLLLHLTSQSGAQVRFRLHVQVADYPLVIRKSVELADPQLRDIAAMCQRTFAACLQDGFVDSVWRESSQWVGDALPQALTMAALSDDVRPLRQVIRMAAEGAYPDGVLPSVLPGEVHAYTVVDYNLIWIELLALYWRLTGDAAFVHEHWAALTRILHRFQQDVAADGLMRSQPGRRLFLDWAPLSRHEPNAVYNLHWLLARQTATALAGEVGLPMEQCVDMRERLRAAFWQDGRWWDDLGRTTYSQLATALALLTGCSEADETDALLDAIVGRSFDLTDDHRPGHMVLASPFMHHYVFQALRRYGRHAEVVEIVRRRWGRWAAAGCPTTWENWQIDFPDGSRCHGFSAHPLYHLVEMTPLLTQRQGEPYEA